MNSISFIPCFFVLLIAAGNEKNVESVVNAVQGKIYFAGKSLTADNSDSKKSFLSNEFIYGRLQLTGQTIRQAFKMRETSKALPYPFLVCNLKLPIHLQASSRIGELIVSK